MKKLLFSVLAALLVVNMFAADTSEQAQQQKVYQWSAQFDQERLHITPAYSNSVYQAILPRLAEAVQQLELPLPLPFTAEQVKVISIYQASPDVTTGFADGSCLLMDPCGLFYLYHSPSSLFYEGTFRKRFYREDTSVYTTDVSAFMGQNRMNREEIIGMARQLKERLCKTGYSDVLFSIEGEPQVEGPFDVKDGQVPYAKVSWGENLSGSWDNYRGICLHDRGFDDLDKPAGNYFEVEINTDKKQIVSFWVKPTIENLAKHFSYQTPEGLPLKLTEKVETETEYQQRVYGKRSILIGKNIHVTPVYSNAVLALMLPEVNRIAKKLELPIELPVTTEQVKGFSVDPKGYLGGKLFLKNGWQFNIGGSRFFISISDGVHRGQCNIEVISPHCFFTMEDKEINLEDYYGTNKMSEAEIIEYSKKLMNRLGFEELMKGRKQPNQMDGPFPPEGEILKEIPRAFVRWRATGGEPFYFVTIEINTETKEIDRVSILMDDSLSDYDVVMPDTDNKDLIPEIEPMH
ncbi:MAG: hypothetical protein J5773_01655 [Verrucomicrobia bacterium]|nr:hypothetical protein [Verrucomicrobiota bacterium]